MRHLDLFSGIGGFALAARWAGWETIGFCEIDEWCQKILRKHWPNVPIHSDIRKLHGDSVGPFDIITGGYPCQPFSSSGKRRGAEDNRYLWPEVARLIRELRPPYAVFENVIGHVHLGLDDVLSDLENLGYSWESFVIPACSIGACHRRDRIWIVAYTLRGRQTMGRDSTGGWRQSKQIKMDIISKGEMESSFRRENDGIPNRVDRLRGLGNAIVPQVAHVIFEAINVDLSR